ncbi:RHS repeat-associated core domain-containing protein [Curtobacterium phoenicis]|uniref:RHS repeat-associated core domain-containing protein n=1 Tax=Curtobacterium sp. 1P10AnD TaxID=3132283 RepID=UPI0039A1929B
MQWQQNPYGFKAGLRSSNTDNGLTKFGYRWKSSATGGWIERDTLDAPLSPTNANRYAYAGSDPINLADPTGRVSGADVAGIFAGAAAGAAVATVVCGVTAGAGCGAGVYFAGFLGSSIGSAVGSATTAALNGDDTQEAFLNGLGTGAVGGALGPAGRFFPKVRL